MKKSNASLFIIAMVASTAWASSSGSQQGAAVVKPTVKPIVKPTDRPTVNPDSSNPAVVQNQLLVRFKDEVKEEEVKKVMSKHSLKFVQKLGSMNLYLAEVAENSTTQEAQVALKGESAVKYSEPNSVMRTFKK